MGVSGAANVGVFRMGLSCYFTLWQRESKLFQGFLGEEDLYQHVAKTKTRGKEDGERGHQR